MSECYWHGDDHCAVCEMHERELDDTQDRVYEQGGRDLGGRRLRVAASPLDVLAREAREHLRDAAVNLASAELELCEFQDRWARDRTRHHDIPPEAA